MMLVKRITQNFTTGQPQSDLVVSVDYDPKHRTVEGIISVIAFNHRTKICTDITAILAEQFPAALDNIIDEIKWDEVHSEKKSLTLV